jgi:hypothetical protein
MVQKNRHLVDAFLLRRAPEFVYRRQPRALGQEIPVFTFHAVVPELLEAQCRFLVRNGYGTLSAAELSRCLTGDARCSDSVVLTFDDGLKQVWSVAHPILAKYGLKGICFLVPGCIPDDDRRVRLTMADVWAEAVAEADVVGVRPGEPALATWAEISLMREAGTFEFHSHTFHHALVPVSERVFSFAGPHYDPHVFGNVHIPLYERGGRIDAGREPLPGLPIFDARPRMCAERRFVPDEDLLDRCVDTVAEEGAEAFFQRRDWRSRLEAVVSRYGRERGALGRFEPRAERNRVVREELEGSRLAIEARLPGSRADHLCYPWFAAKRFALEAARDVGFTAGYLGSVRGRPTNRPGDDLSTITRLDELYLERLPGEGRLKLGALARRLFHLRSLPDRLFPDRSHRPPAGVDA